MAYLSIAEISRKANDDPNQKIEITINFTVANKNLDEAAMIVGGFGSQWCSELNMSKKYGWRVTHFNVTLNAPAYLLRDFLLTINPLIKR